MLRILVVDDDKTMCEEFSELLKEEGNQVATAHDGKSALLRLGERELQVLFTDLKMPRMNGLDLLREVRRLHPSIYAVMVTGYATVETAVEALKMGAFDYVQKPFRIEQVRLILKRVEEERRFREPWTAWSSLPAEALHRAVKAGAHPIVFAKDSAAFPGIHVVHFDATSSGPGSVSPRDIHRVKELALMHCASVARPVVLVERIEVLSEGHDWKDLLAVLTEIQRACEAKGGSLMLTLDPSKLSQSQVAELRKLAGEPFVAELVDILGSPIRRSVIDQLVGAPALFSEIMRGTEVDDSPKLTFHLKKMVAAGFLVHESERYALSDKGTRAARFLGEMETEGSLKLAGPGMLFETKV